MARRIVTTPNGVEIGVVNLVAEVASPLAQTPTPAPAPKRKRATRATPIDPIYVVSKEGCVVCDKAGKPKGFVSHKSIASEVIDSRPIDTGLLEKNIIWMRRNQVPNMETHSVLFEFDPMQIRIPYRQVEGKDIELLQIYLPYVQFYLHISSVASGTAGKQQLTLSNSLISCTTQPIRSMDDALYELPINNIQDHGGICWGYGSGSKLHQLDTDTPLAFARRICNTFFSIPFNTHLQPNWPEGLRSYAEWTEKYNSLNILTIKFRAHHYSSVRKAIAYVTGQA